MHSNKLPFGHFWPWLDVDENQLAMYSIHDIMEMMVPWFDGGTYIIDRSSHESKGALQQNYVDTLCLSYLGSLIENLNLVPFQSEGDGNCLLHAVCKAVSGKDTQFAALRESMTQELVENEPWYRFHLHLDDSEWNKSLNMARGDGNYLGFEHIFALSNVLRRPILLLDNLSQVQTFGEGDVRLYPVHLPLSPLLLSIPFSNRPLKPPCNSQTSLFHEFEVNPYSLNFTLIAYRIFTLFQSNCITL